MIIDFILFATYGLITTLFGFFPTVDTATLDAVNSISENLQGYLNAVSWLLPVPTILIVLSAVISIELSILLFHTIKYVASTLSLGFIRQ